jgi:hypothetical protein
MKQNNKTFCNCFKLDGEGSRGRDGGDVLTNVQYKPIWNCHNESPLYNEYILMRKEKSILEMSNVVYERDRETKNELQ